MMAGTSNGAGLMQALAQRLERRRIPRALSLKQKVYRGETLNEFDIDFLEEVFEDAWSAPTLLERHPEWRDLVAKLIQLYKEITEKALENEKAKGDGFPLANTDSPQNVGCTESPLPIYRKRKRWPAAGVLIQDREQD